MSGDRLRLGFIALNDAAALIVADALGYFAEEGLAVDLVREVSWATVRDKLAVGALDGAHLLAPLTLAVVFPYSVHAYLLRDWLARARVDPDRDVRLTVAPPARMTELLVGGVVEGFCVTEPWDSAAVAAGAGTIMVRGGQLWPRTPDKVFAVAESWADADPPRLRALLRALLRTAPVRRSRSTPPGC